jgi:hypothetical protein
MRVWQLTSRLSAVWFLDGGLMAHQGYSSLVMGGTGMLADATRWLVAHSVRSLVVSRNASRFVLPTSSGLKSLDANWEHPSYVDDVRNALRDLIPITHSLIWLHKPEPILERLLPLLPGANNVIVLGSMDAQPSLPLAGITAAYVRLGSMATTTGRRWLTHQEISDAAIVALVDGQSRQVGELRSIC